VLSGSLKTGRCAKFQCCIRFWSGFESGFRRDLAITKVIGSSKGHRGSVLNLA
jgi:hypothetical protein